MQYEFIARFFDPETFKYTYSIEYIATYWEAVAIVMQNLEVPYVQVNDTQFSPVDHSEGFAGWFVLAIIVKVEKVQ